MDADVVFEGRVLAVGPWAEDKGSPVVFEVHAAWSGLEPTVRSVTTWVYAEDCGCIIGGRPREQPGDVWLVTATLRDGEYFGGGCGSTEVVPGAEPPPQRAELGAPKWQRRENLPPTFRFSEAILAGDVAAAQAAVDAGADGSGFDHTLHALVVSRCDPRSAGLLTQVGATPSLFLPQDTPCSPTELGALVRAVPAEVWTFVLDDRVSRGNLEAVREMIDAGVALDGKPWTDLIADAASRGHDDMARMLWDRGAPVRAADVLAASKRPALADLVARPREPFPPDDLCRAAGRAGTASLQWLLDHGLRGVACDNPEGGPIWSAANAGDTNRARMALAAGGNPNETGERGTTALMQAVAWDHPEVAAILLEAGATIEVTDRDGASALEAAVKRKEPTLLKMLLEAGADPDFAGGRHATVLWQAIERGRADMVAVLLEAGADPDWSGPEGRTPRTLAVQRGNAEVQALLAARP